MYKCRIWFVVSLVFLALYVLSKFSNIAKGLFGSHEAAEQVSIGGEFLELIFYLLIEGYQLWVVYAFMDELKEDARRGGGPGGEAAVHYAPKNNIGDHPPPYGQAGYMPYAPSGTNEKPPQVVYPSLPADDTAPYKPTTTGF